MGKGDYEVCSLIALRNLHVFIEADPLDKRKDTQSEAGGWDARLTFRKP